MRWDEAEFLRRTEGSPIRRIGHARWLRNVALALGNAAPSANSDTRPDAAERAAVVQALQGWQAHASAVVREQVAWSLARWAQVGAAPGVPTP